MAGGRPAGARVSGGGRLKTKRRRLRSVEAEIVRIADANGVAPDAVGFTRELPKLREMLLQPGAFEVVREHSDSGRVQLVYWDQAEEAAEAKVRFHNMLIDAGDVDHAGKTDVQGGALESGWRYTARSQGHKPKGGAT